MEAFWNNIVLTNARLTIVLRSTDRPDHKFFVVVWNHFRNHARYALVNHLHVLALLRLNISDVTLLRRIVRIYDI